MRKDGKMSEFFEIKGMDKKDKKKIIEEIEKRILQKKKEGILTDKELREIEGMRLRPPADILDVQSVYEDFLFAMDD